MSFEVVLFVYTIIQIIVGLGLSCRDDREKCYLVQSWAKEQVELFITITIQIDILDSSSKEKCDTTEYRLYNKRWIILSLYHAYTFFATVQWIQYASIADVVVEYYKVSYIAINWTSLIYFIVFIPFGVCGSYIIDKFGLRISVLIGIAITCLGTWIKVGSLNPNRYWVYLLGQTVVALSQIVVLPAVSKISVVWFGANEVTLACNIAAMAPQIGIGVGFILPPLFVKQGGTDTIEHGLKIILYSYAALGTILIPILYFYFDNAPPTPPSKAQSNILIQNYKQPFIYKKSLAKLLKNKSFMVLFIAYGVNIGSVLAISVLLNEIVLSHYPDAYTDVGLIGLLMMAAGVLGIFITGVLISKFGKLKQFTIAYYVLSLIFTTTLLFLIDFGLPLVYFNALCLCFFNNSLLSTGFDLGVELTYPEPEATSSGMLITSSYIFGIATIYIFSHLFYNVSKFSANLFMVFLVFASDLLLILLKFNFKRKAVEKKKFTKSCY